MATFAALQRPHRQDHPRICIFVDASNVFHATQQREIHIDFQKFIIRIANGRLIVQYHFILMLNKGTLHSKDFSRAFSILDIQW